MGVQQIQAVRKQVLFLAQQQRPWECAWLSTLCQEAVARRSFHTTNRTAAAQQAAVKQPSSVHSQKTVNPIRQMVDKFSVNSISKKPLLTFHLGDPSNTGALPPCPGIEDALRETLLERKYYGYGPAHGFPETREAIARHFSLPEAPFTKDDVIMTSGCSHALQLVMEVLANPGDNILVPSPGFPLYKTLLRPHAIQERYYPLDMDTEKTRINLGKLESLIDDDTRAIIVNNPSNPTGGVYPKEHLEDVLKIAEKHKLTVVADEVYGELTFNNAKFIPMATLSPKVPMLTVDSISKRYLAPGWRLGWIIIHNRNGRLDAVREGLVNLSQKIVGPSALVQGALPKILDRTPPAFFQTIKDLLSSNAKIAYDRLCKIPGLRPIKPSGAMYLIVEFDPKIYGEENKFMQELIYEENVFCLPGSVFFYPNIFRLVLIYPNENTIDACDRIAAFCKRKLSK